ncbi:MAG: polyphosphate kinase 1 [Ignavibacteriales bacterium]|nr:MAG: polyphosphate kinase 1 [Ignavibacteriales bacterium]
MTNKSPKKNFDRELSWLSFNHRVLQESEDESVPLFERIKFLAIYSSNLDEFFRVRVASIRSLLELKKNTQKKLSFNPEKLLKKIHSTVHQQQEKFGFIYNTRIIPQLAANGIHIVDDNSLPEKFFSEVTEYFRNQVLPAIQPVILDGNKITTFLHNRHIYFAVKLKLKKPDGTNSVKSKYALVEIPSDKLKRFLLLEENSENRYVIFLDDIIRMHLKNIFPGYYVESAYSIKLTRDAELYIDDEFSGNLLEKIHKGLSKRKTGLPCRFLYDKSMPAEFLKFLSDSLSLTIDDLIPGGRYHNFHDFFSFPFINKTELYYEPMPALQSVLSDKNKSAFKLISRKDLLLHFPYHSYDPVIKFLNEAADDPKVKSISITLYRIASSSKIAEALIKASNNGKTVTAFVEVKARFDEEANLSWALALSKSGVDVHYSFPGMKVHSKICLVEREEKNSIKMYAYLSTGNFNEKTALVYSDFGLFTSDERITKECKKVFRILTRKSLKESFSYLLTAPFNLRSGIEELIDNEILYAQQNKKASIILKLNSLEDKKIIKKLYEASNAGVKINIIVRGICCLVPGVKGHSENIKVTSIVDRYLEHARIYIFNNNGNTLYYVASADLMGRNLNRRIEICFPVYDTSIKRILKNIINIQLRDNVKARLIDMKQKNLFRKSTAVKKVRAQYAVYDYLNHTPGKLNRE